MSTKDNGGSAFPVREWIGPNDQMIWPETGMSLRDWFAGQALAGLSSRLGYHPKSDPADVVGDAYTLADAMIAERSK